MVLITFEESAKEEILDIFDKAVDEDGFIVEKGDTDDAKVRVKDSNGEDVRLEEFAGIGRGGVLIKSDLPSLIRALDSGVI